MSSPLFQSGGGGGSSLATPVSLANGGTHADLSATGGASNFLRQNSAGANVDVVQPNFTDLAGSATPAQNGVANCSVSTQGYFLGGMMSPTQANGSSAVALANTMYVMQFVLPYAVTVRRASCRITTTNNGSKLNCGIYNAAGTTKLVDALITLGASANIIVTTTLNSAGGALAVVLPPGVYWFAWACDSTTPLFSGYPQGSFAGTNIFGAGGVITQRLGSSGNAPSGNVLPSSIDTITFAALNIPCILFEP
jgi:hypothetical protein